MKACEQQQRNEKHIKNNMWSKVFGKVVARPKFWITPQVILRFVARQCVQEKLSIITGACDTNRCKTCVAQEIQEGRF